MAKTELCDSQLRHASKAAAAPMSEGRVVRMSHLEWKVQFSTTKDPVKVTYKTSVYAPVPVLCLGKADTKSRTDGERPSTGPDLIVQRAFRDN